MSIDGRSYEFSDDLLHRIAFAPALDQDNALEIYMEGESTVTIPITPGLDKDAASLVDTEGNKVRYKIKGDNIEIKTNSSISGKWLTFSW